MNLCSASSVVLRVCCASCSVVKSCLLYYVARVARYSVRIHENFNPSVHGSGGVYIGKNALQRATRYKSQY